MTRQALRSLLDQEDVIFAAGAWDGLSALLIEAAGFSAMCSSGFGVAAALGVPDAGIYTMTENVAAVRRMTAVTKIPIIADIDTGYGNAVNVIRTVHEFESAGASAVFLEDQVTPKRCPISRVEAPAVISEEEAVGKIRAALDIRQSSDFLIIARTDAQGPEALERAVAYAQAGADLVMPVSRSLSSVAEVRRCYEACKKPLMLSLTSSTWMEQEFTRERLVEAGVKIALFPTQALYAAVAAVRRVLAELRATDYAPSVTTEAIPHESFLRLLGFDRLDELERQYVV